MGHAKSVTVSGVYSVTVSGEICTLYNIIFIFITVTKYTDGGGNLCDRFCIRFSERLPCILVYLGIHNHNAPKKLHDNFRKHYKTFHTSHRSSLYRVKRKKAAKLREFSLNFPKLADWLCMGWSVCQAAAKDGNSNRGNFFCTRM